MAKTNAKGFFCDFPCGMLNSNCNIFLCKGCATGGVPLKPNTEYPEYKRVHVDEKGEKHEVRRE